MDTLFPILKPRCSLIPRDYQRNAIAATFQLWDEGHVGTLARLPTGCGKTLTGTLIADLWLQRGDDHRVLILAHERQLIQQFAQEVEDILGIRPAVEMGDVHCKGNEQIIVGSRQTLYVKRDGEQEQSRLFKFRPELNWLLICDESHRWTRNMPSCREIIKWFESNPTHRRLGLTATPERTDKIAFTSLFSGVASDYRLFDLDNGPAAVNDGWAVPYDQRYIVVEGVDFKNIKEVKGDFDPMELERILGEQEELARLCDPMLDIVGQRRTLIFSPTTAMARNVALYLNSRLGHEAAKSLDGSFPDVIRKSIYKQHQTGAFQFLSVCGLCVSKGSRILTDTGEVPIEDVTTDMKVWDGVEFVAHDGVIFKGVKPVIRYAGLTATGNHNVWTSAGWKTLADCKESGIAISVSGIEGAAVRESDGYYRDDGSEWKSGTATSRSYLWDVWNEIVEDVLQTKATEVRMQSLLCHEQQSESDKGSIVSPVARRLRVMRSPDGSRRCDSSSRQEWSIWRTRAVRRLLERIRATVERVGVWSLRVQKLFKEKRNTAVALEPLSGCKTAMYKPEEPGLSRLWREGYSVPIRVDSGNGEMDHRKSWVASGVDVGQSRESGSLSSGELEIRNADNASQQPQGETAEVYDILNAGPRHRFTANGLIVSNCREGYNDPDIQAVAIFRPTKSRSLAEQMKGRGCRPMRGTVSSEMTREERRQAIAMSQKPTCLIIDLVGATGLGDVPSTIDILAAGKPDEVIARANKKMLAKSPDEVGDVARVVREAEEELAEEKRLKREERQRKEQEEADRRAKLKAKVEYTQRAVKSGQAGTGHQHKKTHNPPSPGMCKYLFALGVKQPEQLSMQQGKALLGKLTAGHGRDYVVRGGPHKGKMLKELPIPDLKRLIAERNSGNEYDREFQSEVALYREHWKQDHRKGE